MMQNSGAHDLIEAPQFAGAFNGKLMDVEIVQVVFSLECLSAANAGCTEVDAGHAGRRPAQGMLGGLGRPAARNQNGKVFAITSGRPEQVKVRTASFAVLPEPPVFLEIIDRPWIRI